MLVIFEMKFGMICCYQEVEVQYGRMIIVYNIIPYFV